MFLSVGWPLLRAEGFFCNLDILYGGLGIGKLQFLIKKNSNFVSYVIFFQFLVIKGLDPDWIRIRFGLQDPTLDPDPDPEKINMDPKPCLYSGRGKFMPLPLKSKILETPGFVVTDYIKMFPL
jgi:hypothetical protein